MYTWGSNDNLPGVAPGQTPYLNLDDWSTMVMSKPSALYANSYPADFKNTWPIGEGYFDTPFVWAHSEYTPQQTMRGKMALYGYLYGINHGSGATGGAGGSSGTSGGGGVGGNGGFDGSGGAVGSGGASGRGGMSGGGGFTGAGGTLGSGGVSAVAGSAGGGGVSAVAGSSGGGGVLATGGEVGGSIAGAGGVSAAGGTASGGMGGSGGITKTQASGCTCSTHAGRPVGPVSLLAVPVLLLWRRRKRHS
jgi:hypothetical protein